MLKRIFIGYDEREDEAAKVCADSIKRYWPEAPIRLLKLEDEDVAPVYRRTYHTERGLQMVDDKDHQPFSTTFSFSRFLVPHLQKTGWSLFCDCDFLFRADVRELMEFADDKHAVACVQHEHHPEDWLKMDGCIQTRYFRKNWSSLVLWNCDHPRSRLLTPYEVNKNPGQWLHAFGWLQHEDIGAIPEEWNWLEGISPTTGIPADTDPKAVHFTRGGPWFPDYGDVAFADEWRALSKEKTMGKSGTPGSAPRSGSSSPPVSGTRPVPMANTKSGSNKGTTKGTR